MEKTLIAVERYSPNNCFYYEKLLTQAKCKGFDLPVFLKEYRGLEGYVSVSNVNVDHIIIDIQKENTNSTLGFDVGIFDIEYCSFSSIFHEVVFASQDTFSLFYKQLNEYWLFSDYKTASDYLEYHKKLHEAGSDLEHEDLLHIYRIAQEKPIDQADLV